jgi:CO dehydrogenase maturation factor
MKIAISGKGGVGKSTLAAALALLLSRRGKNVLAVDADPDANLASALGLTEAEQKQIVPISRQIQLIEERTGAKVNQYGQIFKLNPEVSDIADKYAIKKDGVSLLVLGAVEAGGSGCACPENVLIKALITDLVLFKNDALIMDMEAGVEHLGRATVKGVDKLIVVVEPGQRSIDSAWRIIRMASDIGLVSIALVGNKVTSAADQEFITTAFPNHTLLGFIPFSDQFRKLDQLGLSVLDGLSHDHIHVFENILQALSDKRENPIQAS